MPHPVDKWQWYQVILSQHGPRNPSLRLVLLALGAGANNSQVDAWPSQELIAVRSQFSLRQVKRLLKQADSAWVRRQMVRQPGRGWYHTKYFFVVPDELRDQVPAHPWEGDSEIERGDKTVSPRAVKGDGAMSPSPEANAALKGQQGDIQGRRGDISGRRGDTRGRRGDKLVSPDRVTSGWPTRFPSEVPKEVPREVPREGARRTSRASEISESDPEIQRKRQQAAALVDQLTKRRAIS